MSSKKSRLHGFVARQVQALGSVVAVVALLALIGPGAQAGDIYQWVDSKGAVHISDDVPPEYKARAKVVGSSDTDAVDAKDQAAAKQRAANEAARLRQLNGNPLGGKAGDKPVITKVPADTSSCAAKWAAYQASQACFAPYRTQNGIRGDSGCTSVDDPTAQCGTVPPNSN